MELSSVSIVVHTDDNVTARYLPPETERTAGGYEFERTEWLSVWLGTVSIGGRPAAVVELLGRAMCEARAAWDAGNPEGPDDGPAGPALAVVPEGGEQ